MSDSPPNSPSGPDSAIPPEEQSRDFPIQDLVGDIANDESKMIVVFSYPEMRSVYLNQAARYMLDPNSILGKNGFNFGLRDLISLVDIDQFDSTVFPMLKVANRWSGKIGIRDLWGSGYGTNCEFKICSSKEPDKKKFVCLIAERDDSVSSVGRGEMKDRELLVALLGNSADSIFFKDCEGRFIRAGLSLTRRFGLKIPYEVIGKTDFNFCDLDHALPAYEDEKRIMETGEPVLDKEEKETWEDGTVTWASTTKLPLLDHDGKIVGTFGVSRDITERKMAEEKRRDLETKLQLAQRLEAIGSLAAGVAHEINTPTQFVADNVKFLKDAFTEIFDVIDMYQEMCDKAKGGSVSAEEWEEFAGKVDDADVEYHREEVPQTIEQTLGGLSQISRIVGSMKEFSYPSSFEKTGADLNRAIENTLNVARSEWKYVAEVEREFDPELPEVPCLIDEINQVILNLVINAAHAIEAADRGMGKITIRTHKKEDSVCIEVEDTGNGIPIDIRDKLFEPFFTTKEVGKGTGQGLPMVRNIVVKNHGGQVGFDSTPGEGATFRVTLPMEQKDESTAIEEGNPTE